jgi:hypothetical protein
MAVCGPSMRGLGAVRRGRNWSWLSNSVYVALNGSSESATSPVSYWLILMEYLAEVIRYFFAKSSSLQKGM